MNRTLCQMQIDPRLIALRRARAERKQREETELRDRLVSLCPEMKPEPRPQTVWEQVGIMGDPDYLRKTFYILQ